MYALITDGSIAKYLSGNRGIQVGDIKYARDIYSKWTEAERNAIGIYEVVFDNTKKKNPIRIILDSSATISTTSRILKTCSKIPTIIVVSKKAQKKNLHKLEKFPIQIIVCGKYIVNIKKLLVILKKKGIKNILVEGGGITNWAFVKENLVDEAIITITPYLVGGMSATTLVDGDGFSNIVKAIRLKLKNVRKMKNEVILHYEN